MSFETMWPHIRGKTPKKIVSVTFDDGVILAVDESDLRGYLKVLETRREDRDLARVGMDRRMLDDLKVYWEMEVSERKSKSAKAPRKSKDATKARILMHREKYYFDHATTYGWLKEASRVFGLSTAQVKNRITE